MENSKELCVQWDNFSENLSSSFKSLREDRVFTDVTLACEDGEQQVEAHKIILAASSPMFQNLLAGDRRQSHQLIYLRGVQLSNLAAVMDFIYLGEARLLQEDLQSFLSLANDLQLRGLESKQIDAKTLVSDVEPNIGILRSASDSQVNPKTFAETKFDLQEVQMKIGMHQNIDDQVKSMIEVGDIPAPGRSQGRVRICKVCGKEGVTIAILGHVKAKHMNTAPLPCKKCGKYFISSRDVLKHMQDCVQKHPKNWETALWGKERLY